MTKRLDLDEVDAFLAQPLHGILATNSEDGPPQLSPIWYLYEGGTFYVSILRGSVKHRNLERDPRASVCIDGGRQDVRAVMLYGRARLDPPGIDNEAMRWRIIRNYYASDAEAEAYLESVRDVPHVILALDPDRVVTQDFND